MRDPDMVGTVARAWESRATPQRPGQEATLGFWVINGPFHPFWSWWALGVIHLRDIPGVPAANKQYPGAEHEIMIVSLNPDHCPPDPDVTESLRFLQPLDLVYQFDGLTDEQALEVAKLSVMAITDGKLSPDQDYRGIWKETLDTTIGHYKAGVH